MAYPFVESPHVTKTGGRQIDLIVLHTTFQEWRDLEPDGIVGPLTWRALLAEDAVVGAAAPVRLQPA